MFPRVNVAVLIVINCGKCSIKEPTPNDSLNYLHKYLIAQLQEVGFFCPVVSLHTGKVE